MVGANIIEEQGFVRLSCLTYPDFTTHPSWVSVYYYSPRGVKERTGLVSRLLSLLASLLQPWLILGRGIRLPRANATQVTTPHRSRSEGGGTGERKSSEGKKVVVKRQKTNGLEGTTNRGKGTWKKTWITQQTQTQENMRAGLLALKEHVNRLWSVIVKFYF